MSRKIILLIMLWHWVTGAYTQVPGEIWTKRYIETSYPVSGYFFDGYMESDGAFTLAGGDTNWIYNRSMIPFRVGEGRAAVWKTSAEGNLIWRYIYSGGNIHPGGAAFTTVTRAKDGGSLAAGYQHTQCCTSIPRDMLAIRLNNAGQAVWVKQFAGNNEDLLMAAAICTNGGFVLAGHSNSTNGNFTANKGSQDAWVIRIDEAGNLKWMKNYGGTLADIANSVVQTADKGFLVAGYTSSVDGDFAGTTGFGNSDGFILKIDSSGNILWRKKYGGNQEDGFNRMVAAPGGSFLLTGYTNSSNVSTNGNKGGTDLWAVRIDASGNLAWSKTFGGSSEEVGLGLTFTPDNGSLISGYTLSNNGDVRFNNGNADAWMLKVDANGNLQWEKTVGSQEDDFGFTSITVRDGVFAMAGTSHDKKFPFSPTRGTLTLLGNANTVRGSAFVDWNGNGIRDPQEPFADGVRVKAAKNVQTEKSAILNAGAYRIDIDTGAHTLSATMVESNPYFNLLPAARTINRSTYYNFDTVDFKLTPIGRIRDARIGIVPVSPVRPGFQADYEIRYANVGTDTISSGSVRWAMPAKMQFTSATPSPNTQTADTLVWLFSNLKPFESGKINLRLRAASPPSLNNGDTLQLKAHVLPVAGDATPADDTALLRQRVVGSYDPNDKNDDLSGNMSWTRLQQGLDIGYIIRFQNTGTDTAFTVQIRDTLDSRLDPTTLRMASSSHPCSFQVEGGNRLTWTFSSIKLPDSNRNEPASHGYLMFRVKPRAGSSVGDVIRNTASIYFDYNLPVRTNTQTTLITNDIITSMRDLFVNTESLKVFPNPTSGRLQIQLDEGLPERSVVVVTDMSGSTVYRGDMLPTGPVPLRQTLELGTLKQGTYIIRLEGGRKRFIRMIVVL